MEGVQSFISSGFVPAWYADAEAEHIMVAASPESCSSLSTATSAGETHSIASSTSMNGSCMSVTSKFDDNVLRTSIPATAGVRCGSASMLGAQTLSLTLGSRSATTGLVELRRRGHGSEACIPPHCNIVLIPTNDYPADRCGFERLRSTHQQQMSSASRPLEIALSASSACRTEAADVSTTSDFRPFACPSSHPSYPHHDNRHDDPEHDGYYQRLDGEHRALLVGWMRQVREALDLHLSTLFIATSLLDQFMATCQDVPPNDILKLVALASMSVAVKYNEAIHVQPSAWLGLAVNSTGRNLYRARDLQRCEFTLLQTINWRLHQPNTYTFLEHFLSIVCPQRHLASVEGQLFDGDGISANGGLWGSTGGAAAVPSAIARAELHADCHHYSMSAEMEAEIAATACGLAEMTLLHDVFLSYECCTIALACITLAQRMVIPAGAETATASPVSPSRYRCEASGAGQSVYGAEIIMTRIPLSQVLRGPHPWTAVFLLVAPR
ncbi:hypothetical protein VOLCADRAFT_96986 [Volvox carteri f. nagariensis]|uniref:Cyclin-like domain-containing protein n=1 Tax=Volvox carteri f. nagariensis TaxID=3068 RepID=D8UBH5_VOLCA|nr:uncharacterized protein VOLCADRAFT_96986 [Volvox carteri f. nagariensis]EFJ43006.1 hypothetical protein VOLCADRAFT_96986 [Volvox carteri f. nagariensis]|eukprot:XP_002956046.1 hypothetical protein VOLCADRAFT_96986 [Volvox carteri f. nagariensis]